jgi:predicted amidohydrolase
MKGIVKIATTSLATLEDVAPPYNLRHPEPSETLERGLSLLDAAGAQGADLAVLPETFEAAGLPGRRVSEVAQPLDGPGISAVADRARAHEMNVVAGFFVREGNRITNRALLFDRTGNIAGSYAKRYPTEGEILNGVEPGDRTDVFDTDMGRIGMAVCFDINWAPMWAEMQAQGADLVCWLSAYEGGLPLQSYAWTYQYPIISSVWPYHAKLIEPTGKIVGTTSRWSRLAVFELNLGKRLFHTDGHMHKLLPMLEKYGPAIRIESFTEEHLFTLESRDPSLRVDDIKAAFELTEYRDFLARCEQVLAAHKALEPRE